MPTNVEHWRQQMRKKVAQAISADAAISAVLQSLIEMELPLSAIEAAETAQLNGLPTLERTFIPEVDSFRAVLSTLLQQQFEDGGADE